MFIIFLQFVCLSVVLGEPHCSPFHYHEQLLEKMVDVQYKMEKYSGKMETWEKEISETVKRFEKTMTEVQKKETQRDGTIEQLKSDVNITLEKFSKSTEQFRLSIQEELKTPVVLFKARQVKDISPSAGDTIVFKTIVQNEGSGYNKNTGMFIAPVSGTYLFTTQLCLYSGKSLSVSIVVNNDTITVADFGDSSWSYKCSTTDGLSNMMKGDEVKVTVSPYSGRKYTGNIIYNDSHLLYWSYFSGVLLHK